MLISTIEGCDVFHRMTSDGRRVERLPDSICDKLIAIVSPDGHRIAFDNAGARVARDIYLLDWSNSTVRQLTEEVGYDIPRDWSPDGKRIAFFSCEPLASNPQLCDSTRYFIDTHTRVVGRLAAGVDIPMAWSPDGQAIAVAGTGADHTIYRVSVAGGATEWFEASPCAIFEWR